MGLARSFIAIQMPAEVRKQLIEITNSLKETQAGIKCVSPENAHLTLKFLGNVNERRLEDIKNIVESVSKKIDPFELSLSGVGVFPNRSAPKVIWLGIGQGKGMLNRIKDMLEERLLEIGIGKEERQYHAHLTLGRVKLLKEKNKLISWLESNMNFEISSIKVRKITLMKSILKSEGAEYSPLLQAALREASSIQTWEENSDG